MLVAHYAPRAARRAVEQLEQLRGAPTETRKVPRILAESGIPSKRGASRRMLLTMSPVIAIPSIRDNFWSSATVLRP